MVQEAFARSTLRATAYREAGHAAAAFEHGQAVRSVAIVQGTESVGSVYARMLANLDPTGPMSPAAKDLLERMILTVLSGPAAERWFRGRANRGEVQRDESLDDLLLRLHGSSAVATAYFAYLQARVAAWLEVSATQRKINALATVLVTRKCLTGKEARRFWHQEMIQADCRPAMVPIPFPRTQ